jgi:hypothetical protein
MAVVGLNEGTTKFLHVDGVGTEFYNVTKLDVGVAGAASLFNGTLAVNNLGTVGSVVNVGSLTSVGMLTAGTLTTGSLSNVAMLNAGTITTVGSNVGVGTVTNLGTLNNVGSLTSIGVLTAGTLTTLPAVTLNTKYSGSAILTAHVLGTAGAALAGTLVAPVGAGTYVYLTGFSIVVHSGTVDCAIANNVAGSAGAGVYARGAFPPGGGIAQSFTYPIVTGTNGTIAYFLNGAGTASFAVNYWVGT